MGGQQARFPNEARCVDTRPCQTITAQRYVELFGWDFIFSFYLYLVYESCIACLFKQVPHASVDTVGKMESAGGNLFVDALLALISWF